MAGIKQISFDFPVAGQLTAVCEEGEDFTLDLTGAYNVADRVDGTGKPIKEVILTSKSIEIGKIIDNRVKKTYEYLNKAVLDTAGNVTVVLTNDDVISFTQAEIVDKVEKSGKTGTIKIKVQGDTNSGYIS